MRPSPPALGHPGNREQSFHFVAITGVDPEHISDREIVPGSLDDADPVSRADITLDDYSEVRPGSQCLGEAAREHPVVHPHSKPPARYPRLGHLEHSAPDLPTLSDERLVHLDSFRREIFSELTVCERSADVLLPPPRVLDGMCVECFIGSPMGLAIGLVVTGKIDTSGYDATGDGRFPDGTPGRATAVFELAHGTNVD